MISYFDSLSQLTDHSSALNIIDFSSFPLTSLHYREFPNINSITLIFDESSLKEEFIKFNSALNYNCDKLEMIDYEELLSSKSKTYDVVILDFIEPSGLLRNNLLERILYLKVSS